MSTANPVRPATSTAMAALLAPIQDELAHVEHRLQAELRHSDPFIDELAQHSFRFGGKRLRPALLLLTAQAVGEINDDHRTLAASVEMVHTATLVHDDILDEAEIRRHEDTVNARWDNQTSVLLGDYLFTHAFYLASSLETTFGARTIGRSTNIVCEGELRQTAASGNFELTRDDYFRIIDAKTAELCACCCRLGAHYAGAGDHLVDRLETFGRRLGIAFQINDDLLDLEGTEQKAGKSLGTDLANQKITLPLIHLRDQLGKQDRRNLKTLVESADSSSKAELLDWLDRSEALNHTRKTAADYSQLAAEKLDELQQSSAQKALQQISQFVTQRDH